MPFLSPQRANLWLGLPSTLGHCTSFPCWALVGLWDPWWQDWWVAVGFLVDLITALLTPIPEEMMQDHPDPGIAFLWPTRTGTGACMGTGGLRPGGAAHPGAEARGQA